MFDKKTENKTKMPGWRICNILFTNYTKVIYKT